MSAGRPLVGYIAHAITGPHAAGPRVWARYLRKRDAFVVKVARLGVSPVVPNIMPDVSHRIAMRLDHELLRRVDVLIVFESDWVATSSGVRQEIEWARQLGIPIVWSLDELHRLKKARP